MHCDKAVVADGDTSVPVDYSVWAQEYGTAEADGPPKAVEHHAVFQPASDVDRDEATGTRPDSDT